MWPGPAVSSSAALDIPGLCTATNLEAVGTTQNMNGEKMLDKMSARCAALSVASGEKKYIDGACVLMTDSDGDQIFSTFDTRDLDKSQPSRKQRDPQPRRRLRKRATGRRARQGRVRPFLLPIERGSDQAAPPLCARVDGLEPTSMRPCRRKAGHLSGNDRATRYPTGKNPPRGRCILAQRLRLGETN